VLLAEVALIAEYDPARTGALERLNLEGLREPTAVAVVAVGMVVRVTNEPWRAREELPPIEGPRR
jgi:hypothetical protein